MTVSLTCPPQVSSANLDAPRKRRRRAPASGAASDCHRCLERNSSCDRRRPYCSQCLEIGNECSGYKTQLTWGVGVASRGKLRGLSLPIAKSAPAVQSPRPVHSRAHASSTAQRRSSLAKLAKIKSEDDGDIRPQGTGRANSYRALDFVAMQPSSTSAMRIPSVGTDWTSTIPEEYLDPLSSSDSSIQHHNYYRGVQQSTSTQSRPNMHLVHSTARTTHFNEHVFDPHFSLEDSNSRNSTPVYNFSSTHASPADHAFSIMNDKISITVQDQLYSQSDLSSSLSSHHQTIFEGEDQQPIIGSLEDGYSASEVFYDDTASAMSTCYETETYMSQSHRGSVWSTAPDGDYLNLSDLHRDSFSYPAPDYPAPDLHLPVTNAVSPRLDFYMDYYEKVICPSTVAVDTLSNPYRRQILSLAADSESLQHAICALASCNLRMKRKQAAAQRVWSQQQGYGRQDPFDVCFHRPEDFQPRQDFMFNSPGDDIALSEEHHHRNSAANLLNTALSSPVLARHDSVLATLFILCHYRMCESGVAHFKTQFAGAKKLIGMRNSGVECFKWGWMETAFTFFDALSATVNEREAQLRGGYVDMIAHPQCSDHALENFAGVDGTLFKVIASLGRLNLLSQQRPVLAPLTNCSPLPSPTINAPRPRLSGEALADFCRLNPTSFDGNGFATTMTEDSDYLGVTSNTNHFTPSDDIRVQFWHEWQSIRQALETWSFCRNTLLTNLPSDSPRISQAEIRDFNLVSEAFRYAALLYTERLASPSFPSASTNLQQYVHQTLGFVQGLGDGSRMEKFLLWPLFIAGSEAVEESHRETVRNACKSISARGGYANNVSALDVLEKVWNDNDAGVEEDGSNGPFRWTKHMNSVDGEFIMV